MESLDIKHSDKSFSKMKSNWADQCKKIEDSGMFDLDSMLQVADSFAEDGTGNQKVIALYNDGDCLAVACAHLVSQKPHFGKVLRIRHVTVCPLLDAGLLPDGIYAETLMGILKAALNLAERDLLAKHIKFHLRSPSDAVFFQALGNKLDTRGVFREVAAHGSWLTLSK